MSPDPHAPQRASLQGLFFTGLLTLLPIWLTWVVIKFVFVMVSSISAPWVVLLSESIADSFPNYAGWGKAIWVQNTIAMLATLLVILGVGWLARRVIGQHRRLFGLGHLVGQTVERGETIAAGCS